MMDTPRTNPPSRPQTPSAVHHLLLPSLKARDSSVSLHTVAQVAPSGLMATSASQDRPFLESNSVVASSSSSISDGVSGEGTMLREGDADTEDTYDNAEGDFARGEEEQQKLRDQLRRTLSHQTPSLQPKLPLPPDPAFSEVPKGQTVARVLYTAPDRPFRRQYYVLTDAGKPVFIHRTAPISDPMSADEDDSTTIIGVMQAVISVFADNGDKLKFINNGDTRITFVLRPPLYLVCVAPNHEPEMLARLQLDYLHLQIISICTASQIKKLFQRRANTDLQRLLQGSDSVIKGLLGRMKNDLGISFSSLVTLRMESSIRNLVSDAIVPDSKLKDILYTIVIADDKVVTLVRPRRHSIHPADLHILVNTMTSQTMITTLESASASWLPICLPKYNPNGFTHTYVSAMRPQSKLNLICVCGASDFDTVQRWADGVTAKLGTDKVLDNLEAATKQSGYSVAELGIPGLRHFVYKSKLHVQLTMPIFEDLYQSENQQRLIALYQLVYDSVHAKSGQAGPLKLQYIRTASESVMGWVTQPFELYVALSPAMSKSAAIGAANAVARWVRREESKLFIKDAPVF